MKQISMSVLGLLLGANAVQLQQMSVEELVIDNDKMSNPDYMSDMTLADWKLFKKSESLSEYRKSQEDVQKYETRMSEFNLASVKQLAHIAK